MPHQCDYIDCDKKTANYQCSGCLEVWYCNKECQKEDWTFHKSNATQKMALQPRITCGKACFDDRIPSHKQTVIDFGFERAFSSENQSSLLGVYQFLTKYRSLAIPAKALHRWRKQGILLQEIQKAYDLIPTGYRGEYYTWLMDHQWVFDGKTPEEWGQKQLEASFRAQIARAGWVYSGGSRAATDLQIREAANTWTAERKACWRLCGACSITECLDLTVTSGYHLDFARAPPR